jgi:hypothetical protein
MTPGIQFHQRATSTPTMRSELLVRTGHSHTGTEDLCRDWTRHGFPHPTGRPGPEPRSFHRVADHRLFGVRTLLIESLGHHPNPRRSQSLGQMDRFAECVCQFGRDNCSVSNWSDPIKNRILFSGILVVFRHCAHRCSLLPFFWLAKCNRSAGRLTWKPLSALDSIQALQPSIDQRSHETKVRG